MISQLSSKYQLGAIHTADTTATDRALLSTESEKVHRLYLPYNACSVFGSKVLVFSAYNACSEINYSNYSIMLALCLAAKFWYSDGGSGGEGYGVSDVGVLRSRTEGGLLRVHGGGRQDHGVTPQVLLPRWCVLTTRCCRRF